MLYCKNHNVPFYRRKQCTKTNDITYLCSKYLTEGKSYCISPNIRESELNYILNSIISEINIFNSIDILIKLYRDKKLRKKIEEKLSSELIKTNIISLLIEKIVISKEKKYIKLEIKTNYEIKNNIINNYTFIREKKQKRELIRYIVKIY